jgi:phage I-like protein
MRRKLKLVLLSVQSVTGYNPAQPPTRIRVAPWGETATVNPELPLIRINERTLAMLSANQRRYGFERIALDYEHNTVPGSPEHKRSAEPRPIAAHGTLEVVPGEGLFLCNLEWTPAGPANAANYPDVSPAVACDSEGNVLFVHSVALTRAGAANGLRFATLSVESMDAEQEAADEDERVESEESQDKEMMAMDPKLKGMLCKIMKLDAATVSDEAVASGLDALGERLARLDTMDGSITTLSASVVDMQRELVLAQSRMDGKVIPLSADSIKAMDLPALRDMVSKLPPNVVPLSAKTPKVEGETGAKRAENSVLEEIARNCGVDVAKLR